MRSIMTNYDIHFQPLKKEAVVSTRCFGFGFAAPLKVEGIQSLVNRWVKTLFTPLGSDLLYPEMGTNFSSLINSNISTVSKSVKDVVIMAVLDTNEQVAEQDLAGFYPESECLQSAEVFDYIEADDGFEVWVQITNIAGDSLQFPVTPSALR